ncbi:MAG: tetratricopeptide repeat protein [Proteobacteria bacterium]|nr:tetratricopeptide repeat protein [Pseudomonadota bacterium]
MELRSARQRVARTVRTLGYDPVSQDDFPTGYGELRQWLREQIDGCEGLIQLVGDAYGAEPPDADPEFGRVSYTQFELLHALRKGKKTWVVLIGDHCSRDHAAAELDLPENAAGLEPTAVRGWQAERHALQQSYRDRLFRENHLRHTANDDTALENLILKLRDELIELRREEEAWKRKLTEDVQGLQSSVQELAVVNAEKIRAHLLTTIEETHRQELAEAETARDWRERQQRREAADAAHAMRRIRVDELAASFAEIEARGRSTNVFQELSRILAEQGVDEAITYMAAQKSSILQSVRARAAAARERNRRELEPLLRTAGLYEAKGQSDDARSLYGEILEVEPEWPQALHAAFWFYTEQGDRARSYASLVEASRDYREAHRLAKQLTDGDPANTDWRRDLSVSHNKIGNVLVAQGDGAGALAAYRKGHEIFKSLVAHDPANTGWQRDLSVSHEKIGDVLVAQGDGVGALAAYRKGHEIVETLAGHDPANTKWQRDLSVSHEKIGDVLVAQGDSDGALTAYRKGLAIRETLTQHDPTNIGWRRDLSVSHDRIGNVLVAQGDGEGALTAYRKGLAIAEALAQRDPANTGWQRDLSVSHDRIGNILVAQGDRDGALAAYRKGLAIAEALAQRDPANTEWQRDLSVSNQKIGDVLVAQGDGDGALAAYRKDLAIAEALAGRDPANTEWKRDLSVSNEKIGDALVAQGDGDAALAAYRKSLTIAEELTVCDPANTAWQVDLAISCSKLGEHDGLSIAERRTFFLRGRKILQELKQAGRLHPSQDYVAWFDAELAKLPSQ